MYNIDIIFCFIDCVQVAVVANTTAEGRKHVSSHTVRYLGRKVDPLQQLLILSNNHMPNE